MNKMIQRWMTDYIWKFLIGVSGAFFIIGTLLTCINVVTRKVFSYSWSGMEEFDAVLLVVLVFLPLAYLEWTNKQLNVSALFNLFPAKLQFWIRKVHHVVILALSLYIMYSAWGIVERNMLADNRSASLGIPLYYLYLIIFLGFGFTALAKLIQIFTTQPKGDHDAH